MQKSKGRKQFAASGKPQETKYTKVQGAVQFVLCSDHRKAPMNASDMEGTFKGRIKILSCSNKEAMLKGATVSFESYNNLVSVSPYWVYSTNKMQRRDRDGVLVLQEKVGFLCPTRLIESFTFSEWVYLCNENGTSCNGLPAGKLSQLLPNHFSIPMALMEKQPFFYKAPSVVTEFSDLTRLPLLVYACRFFGPNDLKQRRKLMQMPTDTLRKLKTQMEEEPWVLCWPAYMREHYSKLRCLKRDAYYSLSCSTATPVIDAAMMLYFSVVDRQERCGHTIFDKDHFFGTLPMMEISKRRELEVQVYLFLMEYALSWVKETSLFALRTHYEDAQNTVICLKAVIERAQKKPEPQRRGARVPHIYLKLTPDQEEIAAYIRTHALTVVEGKPGTGKTALIEFVFAHYRNVMMCTFVGMMAKSLQKRNGNRRDIAHTIHRLLYLSKTEVGKIWLRQFEVLVIDEFSNLSQHLLAKLLLVMPGVTRIVFVGDHYQLKPIDPGDPMGDLIEHFGSQMLTENLRVNKDLRVLQEAPSKIVDDCPEEIQHGPSLPVTCIGRHPESLVDLIKETGERKLMRFHVVTLANEGDGGRHQLNRLVEQAWETLGVINKKKENLVEIRRGCHLYKGCKIMFLKNYNKPLLEKLDKDNVLRSDPVANGELALIVTIDKQLDGWKLVLRDSDDVDADTKVVWIHKSNDERGVHPNHVDLGYATTTYKTQGREFPFVLLCIPTDPNVFWTRSHTYVGVSRAQRKCWVAGEWSDFLKISSRPDPYRRTCFGQMLRDGQSLVDNNVLTHYTPAPIVPLGDLVLIKDGKEAVVPSLQEIAEQRKNKKQHV